MKHISMLLQEPNKLVEVERRRFAELCGLVKQVNSLEDHATYLHEAIEHYSKQPTSASLALHSLADKEEVQNLLKDPHRVVASTVETLKELQLKLQRRV